MGQRRPWIDDEDKLIYRFIAENQNKNNQSKMKWNDIAEQINKLVKGSARTGKQCRERWHNQLDPNVRRNQEWSDLEINQLLNQQKKFGNKWSQIAKKLPGRTDNNVKNFFYSALRRGVRRINTYIIYLRKKKIFKKQFSQSILSKILGVTDDKRNKMDVKNIENTRQLAKKIRDRLIRLAQDQKEQTEIDEKNAEKKQQIINDIMQFNKNCKRRKGKKNIQDQSENESIKEQHSQQQILFQKQQKLKIEKLPSKKGKAITKASQRKVQKQKKLTGKKSDAKKIVQNEVKELKVSSQINTDNSLNRIYSNQNRSSSFKKFVDQQQRQSSIKTKKIHKQHKNKAKGCQKAQQIKVQDKKKVEKKQSLGAFSQTSQRFIKKQTLGQSLTFSKLIAQHNQEMQKKADQYQSFITKIPFTRKSSSLRNSHNQNIQIPFSDPQFADMLQSIEYGTQLNRQNSFGIQKSLDLFNLAKSGQMQFPYIGMKRDNSLLGGLESQLNFQEKKDGKKFLRKRQSFLLKSNDSFRK